LILPRDPHRRVHLVAESIGWVGLPRADACAGVLMNAQPDCRRRARASIVTATTSTTAVTTYFAAALNPSRPIPLLIAAMTTPPRTPWIALPRPPNRLVPPMTAAATAYSTRVPPSMEVEMERSREA